MKKSSLLLVASLATLVTAASALALPTPAPGSVLTKPVPTKIVHPAALPPSFENAVVRLTLTVDESGVPHDIVPVGYLPKAVAARVLPAVAQWRFTPAQKDGHPVRTHVIMPLRLVPGA